jgi:hypothetical protein
MGGASHRDMAHIGGVDGVGSNEFMHILQVSLAGYSRFLIFLLDSLVI